MTTVWRFQQSKIISYNFSSQLISPKSPNYKRENKNSKEDKNSDLISLIGCKWKESEEEKRKGDFFI